MGISPTPHRPGYAALSSPAVLLAAAVIGALTAAPPASAAAASAAKSTPVQVRHLCAAPAHVHTASCLALVRTDVTQPAALSVNAVTPNATPSGYGPSDLLSAYSLPANGGAGQTVAIVDALDDPNAEADLAVYRSQYGLPACSTANGCFTKVDQTGGTNYPSADSGWAGEISLDLDMVSAIAPNAHILLVEAASANMDDLGKSVNEAVALGAKFVSNSYGGSESSTDTSYDSSYFNHPGVVLTVSAGDQAYGAEYPAASPYVTAVGGTSLSKASNTRGWTESVWGTSSTEGTGSGCSAYEPKPGWQTDTGCSKRTVADVSAVADPATGVAVYDSYQTSSGWNEYGGTSAAAPIIAGVYADAGTPGTGDNPAKYPYQHTGALNDVTGGSNGSCSPSYLCTAGTGYDGPTGLGTPNGLTAFAAGTGTAETVAVTNPGAQTGTVGTAVSRQMSATDSAGKTLTYSASGLPAGLSISSSGLITGSPAKAATSTTTITAASGTASGSATFTWTVNAQNANTITVANPGTQTGTVGTAATLQAKASDSASGQTLTYSAANLPAGLTISPSSGLISGTPTTAGTSSVTITATDTTGASGSATFTWTVASASSGCTGAQLIRNGGFENGTVPWTGSTATIGQTALFGLAPHSGSYAAILDDNGYASVDALAQTVNIPAGCTNANLSFWRYITTSELALGAADTLKVQVLDSSGTVLATLHTYSNLNADNQWDQATLSLSQFAGKTVTLRFAGTETDAYYGTTAFGLDDIALTVS
ncbi:putative Ig domain-containing protein [Kitasatospora sp. NPDC006697]|uniref:putative Ig domain-containing protein n=1 Tax=Kitasatospora sp. NPDC006697 TaxID=3364020 RepID=UPI003678B545